MCTISKEFVHIKDLIKSCSKKMTNEHYPVWHVHVLISLVTLNMWGALAILKWDSKCDCNDIITIQQLKLLAPKFAYNL